MIEATKTGPGVIEAIGTTVRHRTPVLELCRELVAAGFDGPMTVRDTDGRALMTVRCIVEAAKLTVDESRDCRFSRWKPHPGKHIFGEEVHELSPVD
jgi:hypothetical protein